MVIERLPNGAVKLLKSTQVITSLRSVVKELVENSLDAEATALTVKLDNYGFSRLEIRDNGTGIGPDDIQFVAKQHYTSKIKDFSDLAFLISYGFRGEALASLCAVADVSITTRMRAEDMGHTYTFDYQGNVSSTKPAASPIGTTVVVTNLFKNVPVRRQYYNNNKRRKEELKKVEDAMMAFAMVVPALHVSLYHERSLIFQKVSAQELRGSVLNTLPSVATKLVHASAEEEQTKVVVFLPPALGRDVPSFSRSTPDRLFVFVNDRHVHHKSIDKVVKAHFGQGLDGCHNRYPIGMVSVSVPLHLIDVNLEPNKDKVLLHEEETVIGLLIKVLEDLYGVLHKSQNAKDIKEKKLACEDITCTYAAVTQPKDKECKKENMSEKRQTTDGRLVFDIPVKAGCLKDHKENRVNFTENRRPEGPEMDKKPLFKPIVSTQISNDGSVIEKGNGKVPFSASLSSVQQEDSMAELKITWDSDFSFNVSAGFQTNTKSSHTKSSHVQDDENGFNNLEKDLIHENTKGPMQNKADKSEECLVSENSKGPTQEESRNDFDLVCKEDSSSDQPMNSKLHVTMEGEDGVPMFVISQLDRPKAFDDKENMEIRLKNAGSDIRNESKKSSEVQQDNCRETLEEEDRDILQKKTPAQEKVVKDGTSYHPHHQNVTTNAVQGGSLHKNLSDRTPDLNELSTWSKGLLKGSEGGDVQTISLAKPPVFGLTGSKAAPIAAQKRSYPDTSVCKISDGASKSSSARGVKKACLSSVGVANYDYINGKPLKKPANAFILFSREIRGKVLSEFPGQDFAIIAKELAVRWKNLDKEKKEKYEKIALRDQERYQREWKHINGSRGVTSTSPNASINRSTLDRFVAPTPPANISLISSRQSQRETRKCREIKVDMKEIQRKLKERESKQDTIFQKMMVIGPVGSSCGWLGHQGQDIFSINAARLQEVILYNSMMSTFVLPASYTRDPIPFNASVLGKRNWETLLLLKKEVSPTTKVATVSDPRITANGFKVNLYPTSQNVEDLSHGELVALSNCIGFYGLLDLQEVLATLTTSPAATLQQTRPVKLRHWMQGEAVRLARTSPIARNSQELLKKLNEHLTKEKVNITAPPYHLKCLHNKPLLTSICSLDNLPQSQEHFHLSQSFIEASVLDQYN